MKKRVIISLLATVLLFTGCNTKGEIVKKKEEKLYFDFSHTEIVRHLEDKCFMKFTPIAVIDSKTEGEKIATYTVETILYGTENVDELVHYQFYYNDTTKKVSYISFFLNRDALLAGNRYPHHIYSIVEYINPDDENVKTGTLTPLIQEEFDKYDFAIYEGGNFELHASRSDDYFDASFRPIKDTKGE